MNKISFETKISDILEEMKAVYKNDNRPWVIGYSGGKDSTTVVQLVYKMLENLPIEERHKNVYVVSSDTLIENPIILGYLEENSKLIGDSAAKQGIPIFSHMVRPDYNNSYWANIIGKGLPTPTSIRFRWCTERLKIKPSNKFIEEKVKENGEVVVLLGVRKAESIARKIRIENRQIDGYLLTPHGSLQNTYVYNPIVDLTTDDVWNVLLSDNGITPWGGNNNDLFSLYMGADSGECPFTITSNEKGEVDTPSCGNSRFGCWICTVVKEDKSLTGFIENGEESLRPLLNFRNWMLSIRDKHEYRMQYRRDGNHYYKKIYLNKLPLIDDTTLNKDNIFYDEYNEAFIDLKNSHSAIAEGKTLISSDKEKIYLDLLPLIDEIKLDSSKILTDEKGQYVNVLGYGPFNFKARKLILKKLLEMQKSYIDEGYEFQLITLGELEAIDQLWDQEEDLTRRSLVNIYYEVMGTKLPWDDYKKPLFDESALNEISTLCEKHDIPDALINKLLIETNRFKHFTNKTILDKSITKILNQKYLHKSIVEEISNDN